MSAKSVFKPRKILIKTVQFGRGRLNYKENTLQRDQSLHNRVKGHLGWKMHIFAT